MFRVISEKTGVPEGYRNPPGEVLGLSGPEGRERAAAQEVARPLPWGVRIGLGEGGPSFPLPLPLFPSPFSLPSWTRRRTPPSLARLKGRPASPPCLFIYRGRGAPLDTQVDLCDRSLSRVRCPLHHNPR